jgi:ubiquitin carboxyl-terminal hydrolase L5
MAVCRDLRLKAAEIGDAEGLKRERRKRAGWEWENALRRHNFVGFIGEVLKGVVGLKLKEGGYEGWVGEAKKATESRVLEKRDRLKAGSKEEKQ